MEMTIEVEFDYDNGYPEGLEIDGIPACQFPSEFREKINERAAEWLEKELEEWKKEKEYYVSGSYGYSTKIMIKINQITNID